MIKLLSMQTNRIIIIVLIVILLIGGLIFISKQENISKQRVTTIATPTISQTNPSNNEAAASPIISISPTSISKTPTADAKHSGEGVIEFANIEQGSGAQLVGVTGVGNFVLQQTKIYDENNKQVAFSYLKKGQKVSVSGTPGEGYLQAIMIRVQN